MNYTLIVDYGENMSTIVANSYEKFEEMVEENENVLSSFGYKLVKFYKAKIPKNDSLIMYVKYERRD